MWCAGLSRIIHLLKILLRATFPEFFSLFYNTIVFMSIESRDLTPKGQTGACPSDMMFSSTVVY